MAKWNTPAAFLNETLGSAYDMDGYPAGQKYQCWDYGDYFWVKQVGRSLITKAGGYGSVRDCWLVSRNVNAGKDFDLITDKKALAVGDWCIFNGGADGHIGIIRKIITAGSIVELQGENQGSITVNVVRFNLNDFLGAFRYKGWAKSQPQPQPQKKSNETIAKEVIKGLWGNGVERKQRLEKAGYNYNTVQAIVNKLLVQTQKKSNETIAKEVIKGLWGNGSDRKQRLEKAGYNYNIIQSIVNRLLK